MKKYIFALLLSCLAVCATTASAGKINIEDTLSELPEASRIVQFYKDNTRLVHATIIVVSAALVYFYNQDAVKASVKKLFGFDSRKDACSCGCSLECACRLGEGNACSLNASCGSSCGGCCAIRPAQSTTLK